MAAKKRSTTSAPKVGVKKAAAVKKASKPATAAATKPKAAKSAAPKKAAAAGAKKAAVKLTDKQKELLAKVKEKGEAGYAGTGAAENRALEALKEKKVVKKLAKDKATGQVPYAITKAGEKHLETPAS